MTGDARSHPARDLPRRHDEVVEAATAVFYASGYKASSLHAVAEELGISKSSLYHYIRGKEDLLVWICDRVHDDSEKILDAVLADPDAPAIARLEGYIDAQVAHSLRNWQRLSVYHDEMRHLSGAVHDSMVDRLREHAYIIRRLVRDAQAEGSVAADFDHRLLTDCLFAVMASTYRWVRHSGNRTEESVAAEVTRFVIRGMSAATAVLVPQPEEPESKEPVGRLINETAHRGSAN
jgi:AcrR family transcriptional regulator